MSFKKLEEKFLSDIFDIMINLKYQQVQSNNFKFIKINTAPNYDFISFLIGTDKHSKRVGFNLYFSRRLHKIEKFIDPYLDLLVPFSPFKHLLYSSTFSTDEEFRKKTDTNFFIQDYGSV